VPFCVNFCLDRLLASYLQVAAASDSSGCEAELLNRLSSLLTELEPFEPKLLQFNKKTKIKMRKEQENYEEEPTDKEQVGTFRSPSHVAVEGINIFL
jgi:hypothetical protein